MPNKLKHGFLADQSRVAVRFLEQVAALTKDGEDFDGEPYQMGTEDAYETLHGIISMARTITAMPKASDHDHAPA